MRIWDLPPSILCRQHLLGEHRELHGLWNILTLGKRGYSRHPETLRWVGKLAALHKRHEALAREIIARGYNHKSPLDRELATGQSCQRKLITPKDEQLTHLIRLGCGCGSDHRDH